LASNACVDILRRESRHKAAAGPSLNDEELNFDLADEAPSPHALVERAELREQIEAGLSALPPEYRQVLVLREMHQLSYGEIAQTLDLDLGTVKSRISRGRKQLRKFLLNTGNFSGPDPSKESEKEGCK
jgi:RNA polymerase sigma-70 factor (ECF subfamily)